MLGYHKLSVKRELQIMTTPHTDTPNTPGERLGKALKALGLTQAEVGRRTRVGTAYVNDVIHGRRGLTEPWAEWLQQEFGIDKIWLRYGEGQMLRRLPGSAGPHDTGTGVPMVPLPILDHPCQGNPLDSDRWVGSTHPLPRSLARPSSPNSYRYVLRVSDAGKTGEMRDGDLVLVENSPAGETPDLTGCWCAIRTGNTLKWRLIRDPSQTRGEIWGRCLGIVWREMRLRG